MAMLLKRLILNANLVDLKIIGVGAFLKAVKMDLIMPKDIILTPNTALTGIAPQRYSTVNFLHNAIKSVVIGWGYVRVKCKVRSVVGIKIIFSEAGEMWRTIDSAPNDTPLLLIANGVVQNVTYALCASEKQWYTVQDQEMIDDDDFKPTHWQRLPRAKL